MEVKILWHDIDEWVVFVDGRNAGDISEDCEVGWRFYPNRNCSFNELAIGAILNKLKELNYV